MLVASTPEDCARAAGRQARPFVVTIGNFDGMHLGHQTLIRHTVRRARAQGLKALAITFDPHPLAVLTDSAPPALGSTRQRLDMLASLGVDVTLLLPFTRDLASVAAGDFCRSILSEALSAEALCIGHDFRLGRDQAGPEALSAIGRRLGFEVMTMQAVLHEGSAVSSTRIRRALSSGRLDLANAMLGRPHAVRGLVVRGAGRGGPLLGVPTANLEPAGVMMPRPAVYASTARLAGGGKALPAVTCFSRNPTFQTGGPGEDALILETHILDFSGDLYGSELEVAFVKRLREARKFQGPAELVAQLHADIAARRALREPVLSVADAGGR
ncbi:MAG: riboflavin biosynthesis protein RibF [Desulfovibrionaceae bacterium]|nr:riboflavin biosynthesis protein RibF [Desulfovibrionaceae bacterium]